jgi:hypothetical protein
MSSEQKKKIEPQRHRGHREEQEGGTYLTPGPSPAACGGVREVKSSAESRVKAKRLNHRDTEDTEKNRRDVRTSPPAPLLPPAAE